METIDYPKIVARVVLESVAQILRSVEKNGLPKANYFIINFRTDHPGAELSDWLRDEYPEEMTIVLQHWFKDLAVQDAGFWVTLNFKDTPETIYVPFAAMTTFADPSADVRFTFVPLMADTESDNSQSPDDTTAENDDSGEKSTAQVVSLDKFRKS